MHFIKKVNLDKDLENKRIRSDVKKKAYEWHDIITQKELVWTCFDDVQKTFSKADLVDDLYIFNIKDHRLIAGINFKRQIIYYKTIMSHKEYDKGLWKKKYARKKK